ncbi:MAG: DegT/DnrJ/EryC1/StrS aminotransferase family protein [Bacteroidales bacterium]|jgi:dTDP-4-amino-4,6-dideoxygalactose transaminase
MKIPLIKPYITEDIKKRVLDVLDSGYLTEGPVTQEFEKVFASYVNAKHAIAVTSCTTGLEIALRAMGIGQGDEVIVPDYTYPATASVVTIVGAHCVIVDVDASNMLIDYDAIEKAITPKTKAIIPVSLFGNPLDYDRLNQIKEKHNLYILEDAACSIGAEYKAEKVGIFADITVFSLHPRKFITTGEGGMITTENDAWAEWMNSYKHFGMAINNTSREGIRFDIVGTNYKLTNFQSAIGLGQMEHIDDLLQRRRFLASRYNNQFGHVSGIKLPTVVNDGRHSFQSYCILTPLRDKIMNTLRQQGLEVQIGTYALHMHPAFQNAQSFTHSGDFKGSIASFNHCLTLPLFHDLSETEQDYLINKVLEFI